MYMPNNKLSMLRPTYQISDKLKPAPSYPKKNESFLYNFDVLHGPAIVNVSSWCGGPKFDSQCD